MSIFIIETLTLLLACVPLAQAGRGGRDSRTDRVADGIDDHVGGDRVRSPDWHIHGNVRSAGEIVDKSGTDTRLGADECAIGWLIWATK
ncbi:hypothetical protein ACFWE3_19510 [Mycobacteriaceae bacterium NPDC060252]